MSSAPRFQILHLHGGEARLDFGGRTHNIKVLSIANVAISLPDLVSCLKYFPLLMSLTISASLSQRNILPPDVPAFIELPNLRHLKLAHSGEEDPCLLFDRLLLPALKSLSLFMIVARTDWPYLKSFLERSRPPLKFLSLNGVPINETTLVECISYIPILTKLFVISIHCTDVKVEALTLVKSKNRLCPLLETLVFDAAGCSPSAIIKMILSRRKSPGYTNFTTRKALKYDSLGRFKLNTICSNPEIAERTKDGLLLH
ncbi:hypothetical protein BD410DRAFT_843125 [Rickenella mellea]|uniref:F-box domain-containing protein n=1 Tax=Rickenella mellea TaxID=50990 RepID=A0A4Y7PUB9_9AGAM|nr:hypothetical protein BD410DRAFT_843125 [Rickenella mellea]